MDWCSGYKIILQTVLRSTIPSWSNTFECYSNLGVNTVGAFSTQSRGTDFNLTRRTTIHCVLEVEDGARNVTGLDGFMSLGKSSVTKKEF